MPGPKTVFYEVEQLERQGDATHAFFVTRDNAEVEAISRLTALTSLRLTCTGRQGIPDLSPLLRLPKLKQLQLALSHNSPEAGSALQPLLSLPELECFKLSWDSSALLPMVIPAFPHVKDLELSGSGAFSFAEDFPFLQLQSLEIDATLFDQSCIKQMTHLKSLSVGRFKSLTPEGIECLAHLKNLERFQGLKYSELPLGQWPRIQHLGTADVNGAALQTIAGIGGLQSLSLRLSHGTDGDLALLGNLPELVSLELELEFDPAAQKWKFAGTGAGLSALSKCSQLAVLELDKFDVSESLLTALSALRSLRTLSVHTQTELTAAMVRPLNTLTNVENLKLPWPKKGMLACLRECTAMSKINSLSMEREQLTDEDAQILTNFPHLQYLNLRHNTLSDACVSSLAGLSKLQTLYLDYNPMRGDTLEQIVALPSLQELTFSGTRVTDAVLETKHLVSDSLQSLNLHSSEICGSGLRALSGLRNLKELSLGGSLITEAGLEHLSCDSLETLGIENTDLTERCLPMLVSRLPNLKVVEADGSGIRHGATFPANLLVRLSDPTYGHVDYDRPDRALIFELDERLIKGYTQSNAVEELDHHRRGDAYLGMGNYAAAVDAYDKAIDELLHPEYHLCSLTKSGHDYRLFECYNSRAMTLVALGQHNKALEDINRAVGICKTSAVARARRGYVHLKLRQMELALDDLNRAIELRPNLAIGYQYRSELFEAQGKPDLAAQDRDRIKQLQT